MRHPTQPCDPDVALALPLQYKNSYPPPFGHAMLNCFTMDPEYTNFNNGSYGTTPKPVQEASNAILSLSEWNPDKFCREIYLDMLFKVRKRLAEFLNVRDVDEVVVVPNASHGLNTIMRNFIWEKEDIIVICNTTYNSIGRTAAYLNDIPPHPSVSEFTILFPTTPKNIIRDWKAHLSGLNAARKRSGGKIVAVIDAIISNPGAVLPWEEMVRITRQENVWSIVDAAHAIGQLPNLNLDEVKPDFWVSNCHKWLSAKRGCAVLYVPQRNQHIIQATFPTSYAYTQIDTREPGSLVEQFSWNGTLDFTPHLSIYSALDFREWVGGEQAINDYCHRLALKGGRKLAEMLGTRVMDEDGAFTAHMVNVELPVPGSILPSLELKMIWYRKLAVDRKIFAATFWHNEKWWTRISVQIWNEMTDFEKLGNAYLEVCGEIEKEYKEGVLLKAKL